MPRVLLVEDEPAIAEPLKYLLQQEGFNVTTAGDGASALRIFTEQGADLVLLDQMLPRLSGGQVCRQIRDTSQVPIIILSAKSSEVDKVIALEIGADDYITKPYSSAELLARMRSLLRRVSFASVAPAASEQLDSCGVRLDIARHTVSVRGSEIAIPLREFELLQTLMEHEGQVLTRAQLLSLVWGSNHYGDSKTLDVHIKRIRSRIELDSANPELIKTVRGVGYRFN